MYQLRLANITGLDINNAQHSVAIDEAMYSIEDLEAFLEYCRDFKDSIEYATKTEKLDTLATRYKKLQTNAKLPHDTAEKSSYLLAEKVEKARVFLKNELEVGNDKPFSRLKLDGYNYFTEKELDALSAIGSARYLVELAEQNKLQDELIKLFLSKYVTAKKYNALTGNQKKVKALMGATA